MLRDAVRHRLPRFAGQRVRSAEVVVALMNGKPVAVERYSFSILTFKKNGALVSPLLDPHVRARAELALELEKPIPRCGCGRCQHSISGPRGSMVALGRRQPTH